MSDQSGDERDALGRLANDPDAICFIYDRYVGRLVRFLEREGATREVAWDATQETFARLLAGSRRRSVRAPESAWPWLAATGRNLLRDWQRRGRIDTRARTQLNITTAPLAGDELDDLIERLDGEAREGDLSTAFHALPATQQRAVAGRVLAEMDYAELAERAAVSEQTVRMRVSRGLRRMRTLLEGGS